MPSPYRETDNIPPAPLAELRWRRNVMRSARWAMLLTLGGIPVLVVTHWLPAHFVLAGVVVWSMVGAALAVATWMLTARRPGGHVGFPGWLLRGSTLVALALVGLLLESAGHATGALAAVHLGIASYLAGTLAGSVAPIAVGYLLATPAFSYLARFSKWPVDRPHRETGTFIRYLIVAILFGMLCGQLPPALQSGGFFLLLTAYCFYELGRKLPPAEQQWWFDNGKATPGEWVPVLVYREGQTEVLWKDDRPGWFQTKQDAVGWLSHQGYLPAERALAERLVDHIPTDTLPLLKPRKPPRPPKDKQRVRNDEPRVRVSAEAEAADDEVVDDALNDAEPPRVTAVQKPDP